MITLKTQTQEFFSDICDVIRLFLGDVQITEVQGEAAYEHTVTVKDGRIADLWSHGDVEQEIVMPVPVGSELEIKRARKRQVKMALYELMKQITGMQLPWGSLTGIRPTRLLYEELDRGRDIAAAKAHIRRMFDVSEDRANLLCEIADMQQGIRIPPENSYDLYIGIPFCKTRCSYCSFSSGEIGRNKKLVAPYTEALLREIELSARLMQEAGLKVRAAYMGGGTPTAIPCDDLERILTAAKEAFPGAVEWTVEAGRPDTIDREKLKMLKKLDITRISVNPQTFSDETLKLIGRSHSGEDTVRAYEMARELGFDDINMDLIAALPGETPEIFARSLEKTISLAPESITVHSLAIKRSSKLHEMMHVSGSGHTQVSAEGAAEMITYARRKLFENGWHPYYLYRQKYMAGNLENVGYSRKGKACLYNIGNMEETASVLALGAGAISKWLFGDRDLRIERAANVKNIEEYILRVEEMVQRKRDLILSEGRK
ncbi:MAG: coproporphyrinogen dehydrogenase HemZ [Clostridia bacterium]|nr:coproporphyrinogen dehydrogenase HemZ [Clostridia bacterium]